MDRKAIANETLRIMNQGFYELPNDPQNRQIVIQEDHMRSRRESILITPDQGHEWLREYRTKNKKTLNMPEIETENLSTVDAVLRYEKAGYQKIGVLNFASAKNPGGGFLNGAKAQEESLAAASGLYQTLTVHEEYYSVNRACNRMIYTDHAIYSPDVVFFRDGRFELLETPAKASVLTLPAVNMGQVLLKGEDTEEARRVMKERMALALALFARQGDRNLILGAYGCGVFRNDPKEIAAWWKELLEDGLGEYFDRIFFAVLDSSRGQKCLRAFTDCFQYNRNELLEEL